MTIERILHVLRIQGDKLDRLLQVGKGSLQQGEYIMSQADDLNNAVTSMATGFASLDGAIHAQIAALQSTEPDLSPAVKQAIANISHITSAMASDAASLTASIPAATTVQPPAPPPEAAQPVPPTVQPPQLATPEITDPAATPPSTPPPAATTQPTT